MKNDLSVSVPLQQYRRWPRHSLCSGRERGPLLYQRPGLKVSVDLWTYPMIIPRAVSCEGEEEGLCMRKREKRGKWWERESRSKKLAFRKDWKAQITRSACRSSVLKSIHTILALGCQVLSAPPDPSLFHQYPEPYSVSLPRRSLLCLSIIKDGILTGSYRENGRHIWWKVLREDDGMKRTGIPQCIIPPHYL